MFENKFKKVLAHGLVKYTLCGCSIWYNDIISCVLCPIWLNLSTFLLLGASICFWRARVLMARGYVWPHNWNWYRSQVEKCSARISCCSKNNLHFFLQVSLYKYWNWRNLKDMLIMIYSRPRLIWYLILSYLTHFCELTENKIQKNHRILPLKVL